MSFPLNLISDTHDKYIICSLKSHTLCIIRFNQWEKTWLIACDTENIDCYLTRFWFIDVWRISEYLYTQFRASWPFRIIIVPIFHQRIIFFFAYVTCHTFPPKVDFSSLCQTYRWCMIIVTIFFFALSPFIHSFIHLFSKRMAMYIHEFGRSHTFYISIIYNILSSLHIWVYKFRTCIHIVCIDTTLIYPDHVWLTIKFGMDKNETSMRMKNAIYFHWIRTNTHTHTRQVGKKVVAFLHLFEWMRKIVYINTRICFAVPWRHRIARKATA